MKKRNTKDVQASVKFYKPLQILIDKYEIKLLNENLMFHSKLIYGS